MEGRHYKEAFLCGLGPQNGGVTRDHLYLFSERRKQPGGCLRLFFQSTASYKIPHRLIEDFVESCRIKVAGFAKNAASCPNPANQANFFILLSGNGPAAVARPFGNLNRTHPP